MRRAKRRGFARCSAARSRPGAARCGRPRRHGRPRSRPAAGAGTGRAWGEVMRRCGDSPAGEWLRRRRPPPKIGIKAQEIAVWVGDSELPIAKLNLVAAIPAFLKGEIGLELGREDAGVEAVDIGDGDLEVHA